MPKEFSEEYNFRLAINKALKQVHPDTNMTQEAKNEVNLMLHSALDKILCSSNHLIASTHGKTTSSRTIQNAVRLNLPGELAKHAVSEGTKAVTKYTSSIETGQGTKKHKISRSSRAGLQFPIGRVENIIRAKLQNCGRLGLGAPVYLAAVIEYLSAEILELSGNAARDNKRVRIKTRDILLAVANDAELTKLFKDVTLSGGVLPNIHAVLLPKTK